MRLALRWSVAVAAVGFAYLAYVYVTLPDVRPLATTNPESTAFIELRQRQARAAGRDLRVRQQWAPYARISSHLKRAVIVTEDAAFWQHDGLDYDEIRASIEVNLAERRVVRGASTITQQLAKNLYLSPSRNPVRKLREVAIARRLEAELGKPRILEIYLNVIEWGDGIFGCEAAARAYFGKRCAALAPAEAALLAGAIINPRVHNPAAPTRRLLARQQIILKRMGASAAEVSAVRGPIPDPPADSDQLHPDELAAPVVGAAGQEEDTDEPDPAQSVQEDGEVTPLPARKAEPAIVPPVVPGTSRPPPSSVRSRTDRERHGTELG
jgi:monofunctional biosynthetic peptidoglycan transglycosylase